MTTREELGLPDPNTPLNQAARYNDDVADKRGFEGTLKELGLDPKEVLHIAEQRALRLHLLETGRIGEIRGQALDGATRTLARTDEPFKVKLSAEDNAAIATLTLLYVDAIALGWHGHEIASR